MGARTSAHPTRSNTLVAVEMPTSRSGENSETPNQPSLWVQTVLYCPAPGQLDSFIRGFRAAAAFVLRQGSYRSITLALGDCSPRRSLEPSGERELAESLQEFGIDSVRYEFFGENLGSARGHNALFDLRESDTDFVVVINPDIYACPDLLCELLRPFSIPEVGIVEARQLPLEHPKFFNPVDGTTSWASTACMMVRSNVVDQIRGFDSDTFFLYCDDVDFSWRARLAGYQIVYQQSARAYHDKRLASDGRMIVGDSERYYAAEAALMMAWKYSRPDLVELWSEELLTTGEIPHRKAVQTFRDRKRDGTLPIPIDPEGHVAEFVGYFYGKHRFEVSV
jgi:GT2 family glycosyltransferase